MRLGCDLALPLCLAIPAGSRVRRSGKEAAPERRCRARPGVVWADGAWLVGLG